MNPSTSSPGVGSGCVPPPGAVDESGQLSPVLTIILVVIILCLLLGVR